MYTVYYTAAFELMFRRHLYPTCPRGIVWEVGLASPRARLLDAKSHILDSWRSLYRQRFVDSRQSFCQWNGAGDVPCRMGAWDGLERGAAAL